jgi:hypothetical protein
MDYSFGAVMAASLSGINCVVIGIGVQTDIYTPALAARGSAELRAATI